MGIWCINPDTVKFDCEYFTRSPSANDRWTIDDSIIGALHRPQSQLCFDGTQNRFRAMEYLQSTNRLLIATMSNKLYSFDPSQPMDDCEQVYSFKTAIQDMVAIRKWPLHPQSFAVGGQARFAIYDTRKQGEGINVLALNQSAGIRSLAFKDSVISYGTAEGHINFFDLRTHRHLDASGSGAQPYHHLGRDCGSPYYTCYSPHVAVDGGTGTGNCTYNNLLQLRMEGVVEQTDLGRALSYPQTAIYTHEYDPTRTKLFAAGGPIAACYTGQAACLFE